MFFFNLLKDIPVSPRDTCGGACFDYCSGVSEVSSTNSCDSLCATQCVSSCTSVDQRAYEEGDNTEEVCITCKESCKYGCLSSCQLTCKTGCFNIETAK